MKDYIGNTLDRCEFVGQLAMQVIQALLQLFCILMIGGLVLWIEDTQRRCGQRYNLLRQQWTEPQVRVELMLSKFLGTSVGGLVSKP